MKHDLRDQVTSTVATAQKLLDSSDLIPLTEKHAKLQQETYDPSFWDRPDAQAMMQKIAALKSKIDTIEAVQYEAEELTTLLELSDESEDTDENNLIPEIKNHLSALQEANEQLELTQFLDGPYDEQGAILSIHPGQGGTEAMDWAEMLSRTYNRYFEKKDWKHTLTEMTRGEEAGIKSVSYEIEAPYAYGYLKNEKGTHRLVRQSPFNADNLRQTSFALVEVLPLLDESDTSVKLKDNDLEWNFSRAGGAGGQSVNKTNSAVELTHTPSGITVKCREERSQVQNKQRAIRLLKAQLAAQKEAEIEEELAKVKGTHRHASWGNQIRNYVLHPYKLVKDTRTEVETSDADGVLDGDLDAFVMAAVREL